MNPQRPKLVILTDWFVPAYKAGGPIQSCANFAFAMCKAYEVYIITGNTDLGESKPYVPQSDLWTNELDPHIHVYYFSNFKLSYKTLKGRIKEVSPDFVYLNHMFSPFYVLLPLWMWWSGQITAKIILSPRGALFDSALHHEYTFFKKIIVLKLLRFLNIYNNIRFHATNLEEKQAIRRYFPTDRITVINNLSKNKQWPLKTILKTKHKISVVFIARIVPIKNLLFAIEIFASVKAQVAFTIIGPLEDEAYWGRCWQKIKSLPTNISVDYRGAKSNDELGRILQEHHLYILPTTGENFGHSIFEAFLAGRPVLISDKTPWRDLTAKKIGWDFSLASQLPFAQAIEDAALWEQEHFDEWSRHSWDFAAAFIDQSKEVEKYEQLFS